MTSKFCRFYLRLAFFLLSIFFWGGLLAVENDVHFRNLGSNDFVFSEDILFDTTARSKLHCGTQCSRHLDCVTFTFNGGFLPGSCRGHSSEMTLGMTKMTSLGSKSFAVGLGPGIATPFSDCGPPPNVSLATSQSTSLTTMTYMCSGEGVHVNGSTDVTCQSNGIWTAPTLFCADCRTNNVSVSGNTGTLTSPGYPNVYANSLDCFYVITLDQSGPQHVTAFIHTNLEGALGTACYDYVEINDDGERLCGEENVTKSFSVTGNQWYFRFVSDGLTPMSRGFRIEYHVENTTADDANGTSAPQHTSLDHTSVTATQQTSLELTSVTTSPQTSLDLTSVTATQQTLLDLTSVTSTQQTSLDLTSVTATQQTSLDLTSVTASSHTSLDPTSVTATQQTSLDLTSVTTSPQTSHDLTSVTATPQTSLDPTSVTATQQTSLDQTSVTATQQTSLDPTSVTATQQTSLELTSVTPTQQTTFDPTSVTTVSPQETTSSEIDCPPPPEVALATPLNPSSQSGVTVRYGCTTSDSLVLVGPPDVTCQLHGSWTTPTFSCVDASLGDVSVTGNAGTLTSPGYPGVYGNSLDFFYVITLDQSGPQKVTAVVITKLEGVPPLLCVDYVQINDGGEKMCGNQNVSKTFSVFGNQWSLHFVSSFFFGLAEGLVLHYHVECTAADDIDETCAIDCPPPPDVDQAAVQSPSSESGVTVTYACSPSSSRVLANGPPEITCQLHGSWTTPTFSCVECNGNDIDIRGNSGILTSPGYPGVYPILSNCRYIVTLDQSGPQTVVANIQYNIDSVPFFPCPDYVIVNNDGKLCGSTSTTKTFVVTGNTWEVEFSADIILKILSGTHMGFHLEYYVN